MIEKGSQSMPFYEEVVLYSEAKMCSTIENCFVGKVECLFRCKWTVKYWMCTFECLWPLFVCVCLWLMYTCSWRDLGGLLIGHLTASF